MKYFVTSDQHFNSAGSIGYFYRPWKTWEEMNEGIITRCNQRVKPEDMLFCVGDFCYKASKIDMANGGGSNIPWRVHLDKLNGTKILFKGNHEPQAGVKTLIKTIKIEYGGFNIGMTHRPDDVPPDGGDCAFWIVGHVHRAWKAAELSGNLLINIGVDVWNWYPVELNEVLAFRREVQKGVVTPTKITYNNNIKYEN